MNALINLKTNKYVDVIILVIVLSLAEEFLKKKLIKKDSPVSDFIVISILGFIFCYFYNVIIYGENDVILCAITSVILSIIYILIKIFSKKYGRIDERRMKS